MVLCNYTQPLFKMHDCVKCMGIVRRFVKCMGIVRRFVKMYVVSSVDNHQRSEKDFEKTLNQFIITLYLLNTALNSVWGNYWITKLLAVRSKTKFYVRKIKMFSFNVLTSN